MEMHSVANLGTLQTTLATFFPSKKRPNLVSENHLYCRASARSEKGLAADMHLHSQTCTLRHLHFRKWRHLQYFLFFILFYLLSIFLIEPLNILHKYPGGEDKKK